MKQVFKRLCSVLLALALIVSIFPAITPHTHAAGTLSVTDTNIGLSWSGSSNFLGGTVSWTASGNNITGTAKGYRQMFSDKTMSTTLTITNNHSDDRTLKFSFALSGGGSVSGIISGTSGNFSNTLAAGASTTITLTSPTGDGNTNTLTLTNIQLVSNNTISTTFFATNQRLLYGRRYCHHGRNHPGEGWFGELCLGCYPCQRL